MKYPGWHVGPKRMANLIEALRRRIQRRDLRLEGRDAKQLTELLFKVSDLNRK